MYFLSLFRGLFYIWRYGIIWSITLVLSNTLGSVTSEHLLSHNTSWEGTSVFSLDVLLEIDMTEMFSTLYGQNEAQGPPGSTSLGFGPGKPTPPLPQNQVAMPGQLAPQPGDEGPVLRKPGAMNEPFYLLRELPVGNELTGNTNLITHYNLEHAYNRFCGKKVKEKLSNFLPELPGMIDCPGTQDGSSLRSLIEKPPVCGNSFSPLTGALLTGFRLHTGPLPEQYRLMHIQPPKKKSKHKHKHHRPQDPIPQETPSDSDPKKKKKKRDDDPDRKKKKKDKKKKKNRHSPDHPGLPCSQPNSSSLR
ncbi:mediator of RNA polymerase II transcription subunit 19-A isoform X1 [Gadus morhua]|uniref:Mediator of RNA polymerase II transcription subunit 19 n=2 Tax=Gadus TaxID=8048 RepID=A0A8C4ZS61_GADMO|nr:mediator of RNA polymerase II transcription subunit 19 isoform X1 [Gadus morhua]